MAKPRTIAEFRKALAESEARIDALTTSRPIVVLDELYAIRDQLWEHLTMSIDGKQKLGIGAIAAQLTKVVERIGDLEGESEEKELTIADALAEARQRKADGAPRASRRGTKSAR